MATPAERHVIRAGNWVGSDVATKLTLAERVEMTSQVDTVLFDDGHVMRVTNE